MSNINKYEQVELTTKVEGATPRQLIQVLMDTCSEKLEMAKNAISRGALSEKQACLIRAKDIIRYLKQCLNNDNLECKQIAKQLDELYYFIEQKIFQAGFNNDPLPLNEASVVLNNIREGWVGMEVK